MCEPSGDRDGALWWTQATARALPARPGAHSPSGYTVERRNQAIRRVHLLFWGSVWEGMVERREQIATVFRTALIGETTSVDRRHEPSPLVTTSVISAAAHTSPGNPPELLASADVSALVANLMSKRALSAWAGTGETLYCVVLCPGATRVDGLAWFAYTSYRQNMRDVHCGWLFGQDEPEVVAERARKLLTEAESALLTDAI